MTNATFRLVQLGVLVAVIAVLACASSVDHDGSYGGFKLFSVRQADEAAVKHLRELQLSNDELDFWKLDRIAGSEAHVLVPPSEVQPFVADLLKNRIQFRELISDYGRIKNENPRYSSSRRWSNKSPILTKYLRHQEINDLLESYAKRYPSFVSLKEIGRSYEGRSIKSITIRSPVVAASRNASRPIVLLDAGIHAREWAAPATAMYVISELVENAAKHRDLLDGLTWIVVPVVNPDGYEYSHTGKRLWRKTRRPTGLSCFGIDGNRNFDFHWSEIGSSDSPCSDTFHGEHSFSEPETQAIRNELLRLKGSCKFYLTLHSYGEYLLYPWGWTSKLPEGWETIDEVARAGADAIHDATGTSYRVGSSTNVLYAAAGGSDDYAFAVAEVPIAITMELPGGGNAGFNPPVSQIEEIVKESFVGIRAMALDVARKYA
ncbi:carboxypeptidase B-like [Anopheles aquasalis]|uniref:carboxypeptidase B-like n=1 Tax=Anopheles aquasalis TaxID=42839 RepID=UPI00215B5005|nr:carboxypeptidase B-like [Anopheles aquasalis]